MRVTGRAGDAPPARRIVSLTCSNTEIVCALGAADRLVGVDDHSDHPPAVVDGLPRVGPDLGVDPRRVAALEPDLVLASLTVPGHEEVVAAVESAGLPTVTLAPRSLDDVLADVARVGDLLGLAERAQRLVADLRRALAPRPVSSPRPSIAVQWWPKPAILPGRRSWAHDLIERAGGANPLGDEEVESRPVPDEELAALAPDAIVVSWCGVPPEKLRPTVVLENPALADTPAVRHRRVLAIPEAYLGRPSPRLVEGLARLAGVVAAASGGGEERAAEPAAG